MHFNFASILNRGCNVVYQGGFIEFKSNAHLSLSTLKIKIRETSLV